MKPYNITSKEYVDYLKKLRKNVWKILPLYEEKNAYLDKYILDLTDRVKSLKKIIKELEDGFWYIELCTGLKDLDTMIAFQSEKNIIKRRVLYLTSIIDNEIISQKGE